MVRAQFQIPHPSQSNFIFPGHIMRDSVVIRLRERERVDRRVSLEMVVNVNKNLFPILILCYKSCYLIRYELTYETYSPFHESTTPSSCTIVT
jgi:hypothetical protein